MKLKIPPALQVLFFGFLMWLLKKLTQQTHFIFEYQKELGWFIFSLGMLVGLTAVYSFRKVKTTVDPTNPHKASNLVTNGIYQYTRNPMYVAMLFVLSAIFIRLGNVYNLLILILYVWFITKFQIKPEEKALTNIFREDYLNYKSKVPRWI